MIVVEHFDEGFDFVTTSLFLLSHSFGDLSWVASNASNHSVTVTSFIAAFIVGLEKKNPTWRKNKSNVVHTLITTALRPA